MHSTVDRPLTSRAKSNEVLTMRLAILLAITVLAVALPALAVPSCPGYTVEGNNCTITLAHGWVAAGQGLDSIFTIYVPPNASGPVEFEVTDIKSSLGSSYTGYLGIKVGNPGEPGGMLLTLADVVAGGPNAVGLVNPGQLVQFAATQVCWD